MRMIIILGIVCTIIYLGYRNLTTGEGFFAKMAGNGVGMLVTQRVESEKKPKAPEPKPAPVKQAETGPTSLVPGKFGDPIAAVSGGLIGTGPSTLQPSRNVLAPPVELPITGRYTFLHREPPPDVSIAEMQKLGVTLLVDRASRQCFAHGPKNAVQVVCDYLQSLDKMAGSCAVQTWAVYVDRTAQKGFDLAAAIQSVSGLQSSLLVADGAFRLDLSAGDVAVALNAICDGSSVEVVQRPHVRLAHGLPSKIESLQEFPIPVSTISNGLAQTTIQYRKVGLQLDVTPYFLSNDAVRLTVKQVNGIVGNSVEIEGNQIPVIQSQTVETTAELTVGQTIILGGVTTQRLRVSRGILRDKSEVTEGVLYVILSTYQDVPRATPVADPPLRSPDSVPVPFTLPLEDPRDWIDGQLLPAKGWEEQERDFIRSRGAK